MQTITTTANIFDLPTYTTDAVCITTNCMIKKNGYAVMGAGIAKEADIRYGLGLELAKHLRASGNVPYRFRKTGKYDCALVSFPTKTDWRDNSSIELIRRSSKLLVEICDYNGIKRCFMTPPGCGCGKLDWKTDVKPVLAPLLDDRFIVTFRQ